MGSGGIPSALGGLHALQEDSLGDPDVCVAVIDGPVDLSHPCFAGGNLRRITTLVQDPAGRGPMSVHGTHVTSMIFGQPGSPVAGVAPKCRGLILPVFRDIQEGHLPQLDLARAIEQAVQEGAHIINVSGGERSPGGQADTTLRRALRLCEESNVLVVAATGNDGCPCLQVPAALPSVLAVGALGKDGEPYEMSNWGDAYRVNGVLAPGEGITGAVPGGGTIALTGSSFATPLVSGVAALLLSIQRRIEGRIDPRAVADAILHTAATCDPPDAAECHRYLAGIINISGAHASISKGETTVADLNSGVRAASVEIPSGSDGSPEAAAEMNASTIADGGVTAVAAPAPPGPDGRPAASEFAATAVSASATPPGGAAPSVAPAVGAAPGVAPVVGAAPGIAPAAGPAPGVAPAAGGTVGVAPAVSAGSVAPSGDCNCKRPGTTSYVYAIGQVRYDLESDANRDALRQLMPEVVRDDLDPPVRVQPNPYDVFQLVDYLNQRPSESTKLVWTLNLDLTPIYAIEAEVAYPEEVYSTLREALRNGALPPDDENYVSRASIPGVLTDRTIQLYSGQVVPVVVAQARGLYIWKEAALINEVIEALRPTHPDMDDNYVRQLTRIFLDKVYYECRNLGVTPPDRALNFAATNAYQVGSAIARGITSGQIVPGSEGELFTLDNIDVTKSPYCRMDSDCWDVRIKFFSPENDRRAKSVYQFTIDVSREMPVSLAPEHQFLTT